MDELPAGLQEPIKNFLEVHPSARSVECLCRLAYSYGRLELAEEIREEVRNNAKS